MAYRFVPLYVVLGLRLSYLPGYTSMVGFAYQGGEMMMMKSVFWWRKPKYPEETTGYFRHLNSSKYDLGQ